VRKNATRPAMRTRMMPVPLQDKICFGEQREGIAALNPELVPSSLSVH
jgi:hypothetical protein